MSAFLNLSLSSLDGAMEILIFCSLYLMHSIWTSLYLLTRKNSSDTCKTCVDMIWIRTYSDKLVYDELNLKYVFLDINYCLKNLLALVLEFQNLDILCFTNLDFKVI